MEDEFSANNSYFKHQFFPQDIPSKPNNSNNLRKYIIAGEELVKKISFYPKSLLKRNHSTITSDQKKIDLFQKNSDNDSNKKSNNGNITLVYANRFANMSYESKYENMRTLREEMIKDLKKEKIRLMDENSTLSKNISDLKLDVEFLENFDKYYDLDRRMVEQIKSKPRIILPGHLKFHDYEEEWEKVYSLRNKMIRSKEKRDQELVDKKNEIKIKVEIMKSNIEKINNIRERIKENKEILKDIRFDLLNHYKKVLKEGKDLRSDGLCWIIKAIWGVGETVLFSYFPNFLDEKCVKFLFEDSLREIQLDKLLAKIEEIKSTMRKTKINFRNTLFKTNVDFKRRLTRPFTNSIGSYKPTSIKELIDNGKLTINNVSQLLSSKPQVESKSNDHLNTIKELEDEVAKIRSTRIDLKKKELDRVGKEFLMNDYSRRFNVDLITVVGALVGEEKAIVEYESLLKRKKEHLQSLKKCKSYDFLENKLGIRKNIEM